MNFLVQCELMNNACRSHSDLLASEAQAGEKERCTTHIKITYIWVVINYVGFASLCSFVALHFVEFLL